VRECSTLDPFGAPALRLKPAYLGLAALGTVTIGVLIISVLAEGRLAAAAHRRVASPPPVLDCETVRFPSASGAMLVAWICRPPDRPKAGAVLLHCVRCDRSVMITRARLLLDAGYAVLVPDLQAHGESTGDFITFGYREAGDAIASFDLMRTLYPHLRVGGIGMSLGGAALVLAAGRLKADAVVLESVYPTIQAALENWVALRVGALAPVLTPLLVLQLRPLLGVDAAALRPVDRIRDLGCPVLIASGSADRHTTPAQTEALFRAAADPKELWLVPGAAHVDLLRYDATEYRRRVLPFLDRYLLSERA
jgi:uncharacterized protein